jgi:hypothetical protein
LEAVSVFKSFLKKETVESQRVSYKASGEEAIVPLRLICKG